jgi:putative transposase
LEIVKSSDHVKGFIALPKRWIVERTFGWLYKYRRLSKDYEYLTATSEAMLFVAMIHIVVRRIALKTPFKNVLNWLGISRTGKWQNSWGIVAFRFKNRPNT